MLRDRYCLFTSDLAPFLSLPGDGELCSPCGDGCREKDWSLGARAPDEGKEDA